MNYLFLRNTYPKVTQLEQWAVTQTRIIGSRLWKKRGIMYDARSSVSDLYNTHSVCVDFIYNLNVMLWSRFVLHRERERINFIWFQLTLTYDVLLNHYILYYLKILGHFLIIFVNFDQHIENQSKVSDKLQCRQKNIWNFLANIRCFE